MPLPNAVLAAAAKSEGQPAAPQAASGPTGSRSGNSNNGTAVSANNVSNSPATPANGAATTAREPGNNSVNPNRTAAENESGAGGAGKVTVCRPTGSATNPFNLITIGAPALKDTDLQVGVAGALLLVVGSGLVAAGRRRTALAV